MRSPGGRSWVTPPTPIRARPSERAGAVGLEELAELFGRRVGRRLLDAQDLAGRSRRRRPPAGWRRRRPRRRGRRDGGACRLLYPGDGARTSRVETAAAGGQLPGRRDKRYYFSVPPRAETRPGRGRGTPGGDQSPHGRRRPAFASSTRWAASSRACSAVSSAWRARTARIEGSHGLDGEIVFCVGGVGGGGGFFQRSSGLAASLLGFRALIAIALGVDVRARGRPWGGSDQRHAEPGVLRYGQQAAPAPGLPGSRVSEYGTHGEGEGRAVHRAGQSCRPGVPPRPARPGTCRGPIGGRRQLAPGPRQGSRPPPLPRQRLRMGPDDAGEDPHQPCRLAHLGQGSGLVLAALGLQRLHPRRASLDEALERRSQDGRQLFAGNFSHVSLAGPCRFQYCQDCGRWQQ